MTSKKRSLILGCGWSGKITADLLIENNFEVWGTTTQESKMAELKEKGIHPILLDLLTEKNNTKDIEDLQKQNFDILIISIPVKRNENTQQCLQKFERLVELVTKINYQQIIYLSSIGVYEPINGVITEESAVKENGNIFLIQDYLNQKLKNLTVLRLGGLFGFGRIPGRYFSNQVCTVGNEKANYIHGTDVANIILELWEKKATPAIYNTVAPSHPLKKDIYEKMAHKYNFLPVRYQDTLNIQKEVSSEKLIQELGYKFQIPSPLDF